MHPRASAEHVIYQRILAKLSVSSVLRGQTIRPAILKEKYCDQLALLFPPALLTVGFPWSYVRKEKLLAGFRVEGRGRLDLPGRVPILTCTRIAAMRETERSGREVTAELGVSLFAQQPPQAAFSRLNEYC